VRYPILFFRILLFLLLLGFAVRNVEPVTLRYYFGYEWQAPLVLIMFLFFALGIVVGVASCFGKLFKQRREILDYRKKYDIKDEH
jgi:lipopolysaccharide assembly protein A